MEINNLKAIFFDIDDTLYSSSEFSAMARLNGIKAMIKAGLKVDISHCFKELRTIMNQDGSDSKSLFDQLLDSFHPSTYPSANRNVLIASAVVAYHKTKDTALKPYIDVAEVIKILSKTNLCLGVISAGATIKQAEKIYRMNLYQYFSSDAIFITEEAKMEKMELYSYVCSKLKFKPSEVMYVGDRPVVDVEPVKDIGMISVLNRRSGKYLDVEAKVKPDYVVNDFWGLLDILYSDFYLQ